jgi:hypothetical protein
MATRNFSSAVTQGSGFGAKGVSGVGSPVLIQKDIDLDNDKDLAGNAVASGDDCVLMPLPIGCQVRNVFVTILRAANGTTPTGVIKSGAGNIATAIALDAGTYPTVAACIVPTPTVRLSNGASDSIIFTPTVGGTVKGKFRITAEIVPFAG